MGIFDIDFRFNRANWFETFSASLGNVFVRQIRFTHTIVKGNDCELNLEDGTVTFGSNGTYNIQIIGKEDNAKNIWQWAFQDFTSVNKDCLELAYDIQKLGKKFGNEALETPCFELNEMYNGHALSTVACAVQEKNYCYHTCNHPTGALFIAIEDLPDEIYDQIDAGEFMDFTLDRIKHLPVNQKIFVESFLQLNKIPYIWETRVKLVANFGEKLVIVDYKPGNGFLNISQMRMTDPIKPDDQTQETQEAQEDE